MSVSVEDLIAAIEKNGYRRVSGLFIVIKKEAKSKYTKEELNELRRGEGLPKDNNDVYGACALGQASINLGIPAHEIYLDDDNKSHISKNAITTMNDVHRFSLKKIASILSKAVANKKSWRELINE